jgi:hypothetical protein
MIKLVGTHSEVEWNSLIELQKDLSKMVCKSCEEGAYTLQTLLESGCGMQYEILCCGEKIGKEELEQLYQEECEALYGTN